MGVATMAAGFEFAYCMSGKASPRVKAYPVKDSGDHSGGILCNLETGEVDIAATSDAALLGLILEPELLTENLANLSDTASVMVIDDPDAVYKVTDLNARVAGATLDIGTGGASVATSSNVDLVVVRASSATEKTHVRIVRSQHAYTAN